MGSPCWQIGHASTLVEGGLTKERRQSPMAEPAEPERQAPTTSKLARAQPLEELPEPRQMRVRATVGPLQAHAKTDLGRPRAKPVMLQCANKPKAAK